jgi:hypothetical protein
MCAQYLLLEISGKGTREVGGIADKEAYTVQLIFLDESLKKNITYIILKQTTLLHSILNKVMIRNF